jgi:hypothetical protein
MLNFARRSGAMRGGRPDWYLVAERLASISNPELVAEDAAVTRGPGRPSKSSDFLADEDDFLATEVNRVMWAFNIGVKEAAKRISRGDKVPLSAHAEQRARLSSGRKSGALFTVGSQWKGLTAGQIEGRYNRWLKREKDRQKKLATEIP